MFTKVLVPLDGSDLAESILPYILPLATSLKIPITLLSVVDPSFTVESPGTSASPISGEANDDDASPFIPSQSGGVDTVSPHVPKSKEEVEGEA